MSQRPTALVGVTAQVGKLPAEARPPFAHGTAGVGKQPGYPAGHGVPRTALFADKTGALDAQRSAITPWTAQYNFQHTATFSIQIAFVQVGYGAMTRGRGRPKANGLALHHRLYMMLQQQLADGTIPPGAALPSEPDLARSTKLSRTTVRRALARLAEEGMIERRHGSGTYATVQGAARAKASAAVDYGKLLQDLRVMAQSTKVRLLQYAIISTPPRILAASPDLGSRVLFIQRTRTYRGKPFVVISHYVPERLAKRLPKAQLRSTPTVLLFEKAGMIPKIGEQEVTAIAADHVFSRELSVNIGAPLLAIRRSIRDRHGTLLEYHEAFYDPEMYTVQMQVHRERVGKRGMRWRPVA